MLKDLSCVHRQIEIPGRHFDVVSQSAVTTSGERMTATADSIWRHLSYGFQNTLCRKTPSQQRDQHSYGAGAQIWTGVNDHPHSGRLEFPAIVRSMQCFDHLDWITFTIIWICYYCQYMRYILEVGKSFRLPEPWGSIARRINK
jgi:hypothetical protein